MLNFSLANFYNGYAVNQMFLNIIGEHRDYLKRPIAFNQITGSFPFNSWNGDINSNMAGFLRWNGDLYGHCQTWN